MIVCYIMSLCYVVCYCMLVSCMSYDLGMLFFCVMPGGGDADQNGPEEAKPEEAKDSSLRDVAGHRKGTNRGRH